MPLVRVQKSTHKQLKKLAKAENRTIGGEIDFLINEHKKCGIQPAQPPSVNNQHNDIRSQNQEQ